MTRSSILLALALTACGGGGGDGVDGGPDGVDGGLPGDRVVAEVFITFVAEAGTRELPAVLSNLELEAVVTEPGGGVTRYPGEASGDGEITIDGVPAGRYLLRVGDRYFATDRRRIDLGFALLGRADAKVLTSHTPVRLQLENLAAWSEGDRIELFAPNSGLVYPHALAAATEPGAGATSLDATVDLLLAEQPRNVEGPLGDVLYVSQLAARADGSGNLIRELARSFRSGEELVIQGGDPGAVQGSLEAVAASRQLTIAWTGTAYAALAAQMGPLSPAPARHGARLVATPVDPGLGALSTYPTLGSVEVAEPEDQSVELDFGSPLPGHWSELEIDFLEVEAELSPGGATARARAVAVTAPGRLEIEAAPTLGPPTAVTIGGAEATAPLAEVGTTPRIQWGPPALGVAGGYEIEVHELPEGGRVATLVTTGTSVTLPDEILEAGGSYYLELRAISAPGSDLAAAPLRRSVPHAFAETVTAPFSP